MESWGRRSQCIKGTLMTASGSNVTSFVLVIHVRVRTIRASPSPPSGIISVAIIVRAAVLAHWGASLATTSCCT